MARKSTAKSSAVYRGVSVSTFAQDLSNYSQLRRGLSQSMRNQTLTKTELMKIKPEARTVYINQLNAWRERGQAFKTGRAQEVQGTERIFEKALQSGFFTAEEKAALATANLRIKSVNEQTARFMIGESLNVVERSGGTSWKGSGTEDYYKAKYYLDQGSWDPTMASDNMLREIIFSGKIDDYPSQSEEAVKEYMDRLGNASDFADESNNIRKDIMGMAKTMIKGL